MEKVIYVSDTHGDPAIIKDLRLYLIHPEELPSHIIFLGDVVGTEHLRNLQKLFYEVFNRVKKSVLTTEELLQETAVHNALLDLINFEKETLHVGPVNFKDHMEIIRKVTHYGHFCAFLSEQSRNILSAGLNENIQPLIDLCKEFIAKGTNVSFIMGNHDLRTPVDFDQDCNPIAIIDRKFYLPKILQENNIHCITGIESIEIGKTNHILASFDATINAIESIKSIPKITNKKIVFCFHGIVTPDIFGDINTTNETKNVIAGCQILLNEFKPKMVFHGHQHTSINGEPIYEYKVNSNGDIDAMGEIEVEYIAMFAIQEIKF